MLHLALLHGAMDWLAFFYHFGNFLVIFRPILIIGEFLITPYSNIFWLVQRRGLQGAKKVLAPPIMQNMAYFLSFHAKVMQKNHLT